MENKKKYDNAFMTTFSLAESDLGDKLEYNAHEAWDSIGHMGLVAALEEAFGITMETDDIVGFSSYKKGFEILSKYGVTF